MTGQWEPLPGKVHLREVGSESGTTSRDDALAEVFLGLLFLSASLRVVTPEYCLTDLGLEVRDHGVSRVENSP